MIHKIVIENFFSIADRQELVLGVPHNAPDMPCFRKSRAIPDTRLPVVVGFFGPNASGKSTILRAMVAAKEFALNSFEPKFAEHSHTFFQPYMRKDWWDRPSKIMVEFDGQLADGQPSSLFRYELHIGGLLGNKAVNYEALSHAPKGRFRKLFERKGQEFSFGKDFEIKDNDPRVQSIRPDASILSTLTRFNHGISNYFSVLLNGVQTNIVGLDKSQNHPNLMLPYYIRNPVCLERLNCELRRLDVGLEEMKIKTDNSVHFIHTGLDLPVFMNEESSGTQRFINIFPRLHYVLETGSTAVIDELDTDLHPLLVPELFRWFEDPECNRLGAQLFLTAHNPALLDEMEKEQVFFTEKTSGKPTNVYGARDIKGLRRDPSLMKKYLAGELGAVPYIG